MNCDPNQWGSVGSTWDWYDKFYVFWRPLWLSGDKWRRCESESRKCWETTAWPMEIGWHNKLQLIPHRLMASFCSWEKCFIIRVRMQYPNMSEWVRMQYPKSPASGSVLPRAENTDHFERDSRWQGSLPENTSLPLGRHWFWKWC